jgi:cyclopropane fatty-acyl-phospholipid synthase-like methyltransferase
VLALLGPGLAAPLVAVADAHPGKIEAFEWREETFEALKHGVAKANLNDRVTVARIDLEAHVFPPNAYDGVFSTDDFAYCGYPPHLAQQIMKCLKPGACAVVETYVGLRSDELATAFASSFAEPQIRAHGDLLQFFTDAGFALEADEDLTTNSSPPRATASKRWAIGSLKVAHSSLRPPENSRGRRKPGACA